MDAPRCHRGVDGGRQHERAFGIARLITVQRGGMPVSHKPFGGFFKSEAVAGSFGITKAGSNCAMSATPPHSSRARSLTE